MEATSYGDPNNGAAARERQPKLVSLKLALGYPFSSFGCKTIGLGSGLSVGSQDHIRIAHFQFLLRKESCGFSQSLTHIAVELLPPPIQ